MYGNPLACEAIESIARSMVSNQTLQMVWFPKCPEDAAKRTSDLERDINKRRESQGYQDKLCIGYGRFLQVAFTIYIE